MELVALADRDPEGRPGGAKFSVARARLDDLLADDEIDAIDICTPTPARAVDRGARRRKHVLCGIARPQQRRGGDVPGREGRPAVCCVQHRFRPDAQLLKKFVEKGDLGDIFLAKSGWLRLRTEWDSDEWRAQKRESGGGVVLDLGFQMLDLSLWILGSPKVQSVTASVHRQKKGEVEDSATAFFRLANGATLTLELTWGLLMEGLRVREPVQFRRRRAAQPAAHPQGHARLARQRDARDGTSRNQYKQSIEAQVAHFVDVRRRGAKPMGLAEEILPVMELMDAVYRSAEQGKEVRIT